MMNALINETAPMVGKQSHSSERKQFVILLRFVACLLIINSHCRGLYPYYFLAVGGGHGNTIFFILSGYCLAYISQPFGQWYRKRIKRIVPVSLVALVAGIILLDGMSGFTGVTAFEILVRYLNRYWFVWAILLYYCLYHPVMKTGNIKTARNAFMAWGGVYILLYACLVDKTCFSIEESGFCLFKVYYYFGVFLVGGWIRLATDETPEKRQNKKIFALCSLLLLSVLIWCAEYFLLMVMSTAYPMQVLIHVGTFCFGIAVLRLAVMYQDCLRVPKGLPGWVVTVVANSTLEIYLVQSIVKNYVAAITFPINCILFYMGSILLGALLHYAMNKMGRNYP